MKKKNKLIIGIVIPAITLSALGFGFAKMSNTPEVKKQNVVLENIIQSSDKNDDYKSFELMKTYFIKTSDTIKLGIDVKIAEQQAKEEAERIEKERVEKERIEKERVVNIYDSATSSRAISIVGIDLKHPSTFGKYQTQAQIIYDTLKNGIVSDVVLYGFENLAECEEFQELVKNAYNVYPNIYSISEDGKRTLEYKSSEFSGMRNYVRAVNYINSNIGSIVSNGMSETEAIKRISEWIMNRNTYTLDVPSSISLLEQGIGNCNAYATTFKLMCNAIDIQCDFVKGNAGGSHGWNRVLLNGTWFHVDLTFADTSGNSNYLISQSLWGDHTFERIDNRYIYF